MSRNQSSSSSRSSLLFISLLIIITCLQSTVHAKVVKHVFIVDYVEGSPDGVYRDKILAINGQFPGPTIEADLGDTLQVDLVNLIQDGQNTSIHWHGIHQKGSPCEDGASQISQCPLRNGFVQRYQFTLHQAGTYWYHSHVNSQYTDGLWGALIVHNRPEVYDYDGEIVITLNDWYHRTARENEHWHLTPAARGVPPYPDSGMINGLGRYPCDLAVLQNRTCDTTLQSRKVFNTHRNQTYRVRVINVSAYTAFNFSIDGHVLETVEVDGIDSARRVPVDYAVLAAAQRYSFLIRTNGSLNRYLIRADLRIESLLLIEGVNINKFPEALMGDVTAVLQYVDDDIPAETEQVEPFSFQEQVPLKNLSSLICLDEMELSPFDGLPAPPYFDKEFILEAGFYEDEHDVRRGQFNMTPFKLPDHKPLLVQLIDGDKLAPSVFALDVGYMDVVQVVINNPFFGPHPFHLHGASFWVLGMGGWYDGNYDPARHNETLSLTGVKRDTVLVQEQSWAVIRFVADNPGVWTFHCHIDWHNLSGMAMTFVVGRDQISRAVRFTEEGRRVCAHHKLEDLIDKGDQPDTSDATNNSSHTTLVLLALISIVLYL